MRWLVDEAPFGTEGWTPGRVRQALDALVAEGERVGRPLDDLLAIDVPFREHALRRLAEGVPLGVLSPGHRVGLPPRIADAIALRAGLPAEPVERAWIPRRQADALPHDGARTSLGAEWWGDARQPGGTYADRLWGWGTVEGGALPRDAWRWTGAAFEPSPSLVTLADRQPLRPRVEAGPGLLLACAVDATAQLAREQALTDRDAAAVWGAFFLPVLAPSVSVSGAPTESAGLPDYAAQVGFHLLHPRARLCVCVLDRLAMWSDSGDLASLSAVLGEPATSGPDAFARLLTPIARSALARDAADGWDTGIGFRLLRRILRALGEAPDGPAAVDLALHGPPGHEDPSGPLSERLREAFGTALGYADKKAPGAASSQLVDLILLRWSDPDFPG